MVCCLIEQFQAGAEHIRAEDYFVGSVFAEKGIVEGIGADCYICPSDDND